ncbi:MAG: BACON domain-containing protein [Rikenellaceae bacterium]|nr:BACON domain-containing protein [Rikenellaceae bacterium]MCL2692706.1 BACON domain-containing protein [Rikenellaceae bacterium]
MKKVFEFFRKGRAAMLLLSGVLLVMAGCKEVEPPQISVTPENAQIGIEAQQIAVQVRSNERWTAEIIQGSDWVTLSNSKGYGTENIWLNVTEYNDSPAPRVAIVRFRTSGANSVEAQVTVTQSAANSMLMISPATIEIDNKVQTVGLAIASNDNWTITFDKSNIASTTTASGNGNAMVNINVTANPGHDARTVNVIVTAGTGSKTIQKTMAITQKGTGNPSLFLSETSLSFPASENGAAPAPVNVIAVTNIQDALLVSTDFAWCTATVNNATKTVTVSVSQNTDNTGRDAIVTVIGNVDGVAVTQQIRVSQAGVGSPIITLLNNNVTVSNHAQTNVIVGYIKANPGINVSLGAGFPSWITTSQGNITESGLNGQISFDVADNPGQAMRQGVINLVATTGNESLIYPINVIQSGVGVMDMMLLPAFVNVTSGAQPAVSVNGFISEPTATITATVTDGTNIITLDATPITMGANGAFTVNFSVSQNDGASTRTGTILITARKGTQTVVGTISVVQAGIGSPNVVVVSNTITIPQTGAVLGDLLGTQLVNAENAQIKAVTVGVFTATPTPTENGPDFIEITAPANPAASSRTQTINLVATQGGQSQVIVLTVIQPGTGDPALNIPETNFTLPAAGVTDKEIAVIPVGATTYSVVSQPTWLDVTVPATMGDPMLITAAANNTPETLTGTIVLMAQIAPNTDDVVFYTIGVTQLGITAPQLTVVAANVYAASGATDATNPVVGDITGVMLQSYYPTNLDWLTDVVFNSATSQLELTLTANTAAAARSTEVSVVFSRNGLQQVVKFNLTQGGVGAPNVIAGATSLHFGPAATTTDVAVYLLNNGDATVTVVSAPAWILTPTISATNDELSFGVAENDTQFARTGTILLEAEKGGQKVLVSIAVSQSAYAPLAASLSMASVNVAAAANTDAVDVLIIDLPTTGVTIASPVFSSNSDWLTGTVSGNQLTVSVTENSLNDPRTGTLTLTISDNVVAGQVQYLTLVVNQAGIGSIPIADLILDTVGVEIPVDGTAQTVNTLNYNATEYTDVSATTSMSWITVTPQTGITNSFTIGATANTENHPRVGMVELTVTKANGQIQKLFVEVVQQAPAPIADLVPFYTTVNLVSDAGAAGVNSVDVGAFPFNPADYTAITVATSDAWIGYQLSTAPYLIEIWAASANTSTQPRQGTIVLSVTKANGTTQVIPATVIQAGAGETVTTPVPDIIPLYTGVSLNAAGDEVSFGANPFDPTLYTSFATTASQSWITVGYTMGTAPDGSDFTINISATANTGAARTGTVTLTIGKADGTTQVVTATVYQAAAATIDPAVIPDIIPLTTGVNLDAAGTEVQVGANPFDPTLYNSFATTTSQSWVTVGYTMGTAPDGSDFTINISATANTGAARSGTVTLTIGKTDGTTQVVTANVYQAAAPATPVVVTPDIIPMSTGVTLINLAGNSTTNNVEVGANPFDPTLYTSFATTTSQDWIAVSYSMGTAPDGSDFMLNIWATSDNTATTARTGTVTLLVGKADGTTQIIVATVMQQGTPATTAPSVAPDLAPNINTFAFGDIGANNAPLYIWLQGYTSAYGVTVDGAVPAWLNVEWPTALAPGFVKVSTPGDGPNGPYTLTLIVTKPDGTTQSPPITITLSQD